MLASKENKTTVTTRDYGLVSIIMPNYNSEKYIRDTINSVLSQTYANWELLFVDDCSSDNSLEFAKSFDDDRIKIYSTERNGGAAIARNIAISNASGKWIAFLDSDDIWESNKLERQLENMVQNDFVFTFTDYDVIDDNNKTISTFKPRLDKCSYTDVLKHNHIGCLTVMYNAEKLGKVYMPTNAEKREDLACWLSILKDGSQAYCLHECLSKYKVHSNSVSSNKLKMMKYQWLVYRRTEGLNVFKSAYYFTYWAIMGVLKYR